MPLTKEIIERYNYNDIFVETGTWHGDGIALALKAGFKEMHSMEYSTLLYGKAYLRFKNNSNVNLYLGDSRGILPKVISDIQEPITFWLDAHDNNYHSTLLDELNIIAHHPIKEHTILMDDVDDFENYGWTLEDIVQKIIPLINPDYKYKIIQAKRKILVVEL